MSDWLNTAAPLLGVLVGHLLVSARPLPFMPMPTVASFDLPTEAEITWETP